MPRISVSRIYRSDTLSLPSCWRALRLYAGHAFISRLRISGHGRHSTGPWTMLMWKTRRRLPINCSRLRMPATDTIIQCGRASLVVYRQPFNATIMKYHSIKSPSIYGLLGALLITGCDLEELPIDTAGRVAVFGSESG